MNSIRLSAIAAKPKRSKIKVAQRDSADYLKPAKETGITRAGLYKAYSLARPTYWVQPTDPAFDIWVAGG
jgi:hypothetical protein